MGVCDDFIREAYGDRNLSADDIAALQRDLRRRAREIRARDPGLSDNDALATAGNEFASQAEMRALVEKRNTLLGLRRRTEIVSYIRTNFGDKPAEGLKAILVGVQRGREGARASAANEALTLHNQYQAGLFADVAKVDSGLDLLASGTIDRDIARVLWALNTPGAKLDGMDVRAIGIGRAIHKWQEIARNNANTAGAWIGKTPGWVVTQSHDSVRISADKDGWMAMMREHADLARMMSEQGTDDAEALLNGLWQNLSDGVHLKSTTPEKDGKGVRGMARRLSQERVIHFKTADDWFAYNESFGGGNLREAVVGGLQNSARATGLMRVMGPTHEDTFNRVVDELIRDAKAAGKPADEIKSTAARYKSWYLSELDGSLDMPGSNPLASRAASLRALQNMASLGGSVLSSVGDLGVMMVGAKYAGRNGFEMVANGMSNLFKGAPSAERMALMADLGMALESMAGKFTTSRFSVDDGARGMIGQAQKLFFKMNLQNRWTDSMRMAIAEFLSANLARSAGSAFDALNPQLRSTLTLYGIDAGRWDIMRKTGLQDLDGQKFLTPSAMADVDDSLLAGYLKTQGKAASSGAIRELRQEIERQFRGYFTDQNGYMLLTPDAATRGMMKLGTQRGTYVGEAVRMIMQFKSFALAYSQRVIGREIRQGGVAGIAGLVMWSTMAGYAAMTLKDLAKGRTAADPTSTETFFKAFTQGGGLGLYGDILASQVVNRPYDAASALLGPTFGDVFGSQGLAGIASRASEGRDPTAAGVRFVQNNTPFLNLFYSKLAMDYLVFWNLQEAMNPGSLARMERQMQQDHGQQFLISPSRDRFQPEPVQ